MRKDFIKLLSCISCRHADFAIRTNDSSSDTIHRGVLLCKKCSHAYPVIDGIPCFLPKTIWTDEIKSTAHSILEEFCVEKKTCKK